MYKISDKPAAIREVQRYLRHIGYDSYPVIVSGVYDDNTKLAVEDFQGSNGIAISGVIDALTFSRLYDKYKSYVKAKKLRDKYKSLIEFPLTRGTVSDEMLHVNRMISELLKKYGIANVFRVNRTFSNETQAGVKELRRIYDLNDNEVIDEELYIRIFNDYDSAFKFII